LTPIVAALAAGDGDEDPAERLRQLAAGCGVTRLSELGVSAADLPAIARLAARRPELAATPSHPGEAEVLALLRAAV
jgi:alcohol dehydrogenase class IV